MEKEGRSLESGEVVVVAAAAAAPENYCLRELNCTLSFQLKSYTKG
jgi:hypothetical protein